MLSNRTGGAKPRDRRAARVGGRDPSDFLVVPVHHPRALQRPPAESLDANFDRRADRAFSRVHLERLAHLDPTLGERHAVFRQRSPRERRRSLPGSGSGATPGHRIRLLRCARRPICVGELLPAEAVVVLDHPAAGHRSPDQIELSIGRQSFRARFDFSACDELGVPGIGEGELLRCCGWSFSRQTASGCEASRPQPRAPTSANSAMKEERRAVGPTPRS